MHAAGRSAGLLLDYPRPNVGPSGQTWKEGVDTRPRVLRAPSLSTEARGRSPERRIHRCYT